MRINFGYICLLLVFGVLGSCSQVSETAVDTGPEFVRVHGPDLIKPDGSKLYIVGTNLGNWLNPEGYMFGFTRMTSPRLINEVFSELVGPYKAAEFWAAFKDRYITEKDIAFIASTGDTFRSRRAPE